MPLRVLVIDDSAYMRKSLREMLTRDPEIEVVGAARNGQDALEMVAELDPDVVTCDLVMPEMGGLDFVVTQMARRPLPIVLISVVDGQAEDVLKALEAGAVDFVQKPTGRANRARARYRARARGQGPSGGRRLAGAPAAAGADSGAAVAAPLPSAGRRVGIVVIGISTGGPQALRQVLPLLPAECPVPIAVVLHMPVGYNGAVRAEARRGVRGQGPGGARGDGPGARDRVDRAGG